MRLVLNSHDDVDWHTIGRHPDEHDDREWYESTGPSSFAFRSSARIGTACVEGTFEEMRAIARAILDGKDLYFKRCAVEHHGKSTFLFSPRNEEDESKGAVPKQSAIDLAHSILAIPDLRIKT